MNTHRSILLQFTSEITVPFNSMICEFHPSDEWLLHNTDTCRAPPRDKVQAGKARNAFVGTLYVLRSVPRGSQAVPAASPSLSRRSHRLAPGEAPDPDDRLHCALRDDEVGALVRDKAQPLVRLAQHVGTVPQRAVGERGDLVPRLLGVETGPGRRGRGAPPPPSGHGQSTGCTAARRAVPRSRTPPPLCPPG
jgi:hypothetical protein